MADLVPGYQVARAGAGAAYQGVLRPGPKGRPAWVCRCRPVHLVPGKARACAEAELEKREQGKGQVFTLLHCERCAGGNGPSWHDDVPGEDELACPRCGVPLRRLKLVVVGSGPAVD